ncbi:MAG: leucyl/phenylalanyl-tRNA--protein transferase [Bacteroidota bacterium]
MIEPTFEPLDTEFLLMAYSSGFFPMAESRTGPIAWYSPDPRAIVPLESFTVSRSLRQTIKREVFEIRLDTVFGDVIRACAERTDTWISDEIVAEYTQLHHKGHAHSVESWRNGKLVGGLYGVAINGAFFGESMFTRETDASKVALVHLVQRLRERNFLLLDTQLINPHMGSLGACEVPRVEYLALLQRALACRTSFTDPVHT